MPQPRLSPERYTVGWISALPMELQMARAMLDEEHEHAAAAGRTNSRNDHNAYVLGRIGSRNVAMACVPAGRAYYIPAATVAVQMLSTFPEIEVVLMVGIGGAAPSAGNDIRLGDVVISLPNGTSGGVVYYELGEEIEPGGFRVVGQLNNPPDVLLNAISYIQSSPEPPRFLSLLIAASDRYERLKSEMAYPGIEKDTLYRADFVHPGGQPTCAHCDHTQTVPRQERTSTAAKTSQHCPEVFYGTIASGNKVIKDATVRDTLQRELGILCFEMEAAGLMDEFACLAVRGISDYCDSHKNDEWHTYAAAVAAAYTKELLLTLSHHSPQPTQRTSRSILTRIRTLLVCFVATIAFLGLGLLLPFSWICLRSCVAPCFWAAYEESFSVFAK